MRRQYAEQYASLEQWHWWFRGRQRILEAVLCRELKEGHSSSIVSLGSGPAEGLRWLERFAAPTGRLVGMDADPLHGRHVGDRCLFVIGRAEAVPLASRSFDLVLALDVLEHLDDDTPALREAARVVKPGGLLVVTVPALPSLWGRQDVVSDHRRRYTKRTLRQSFTRAGLPAPWTTYFNTLLFPPVATVRWARRALGIADRPGSDFDDSRPGMTNDLLAAVFMAEQHVVGRIPLPVGVSLLAMLRATQPG
jgi:SAM-dependent methyltransferase